VAIGPVRPRLECCRIEYDSIRPPIFILFQGSSDCEIWVSTYRDDPFIRSIGRQGVGGILTSVILRILEDIDMGVEHFKNDCASVAEAQSCTAGMTSFS